MNQIARKLALDCADDNVSKIKELKKKIIFLRGKLPSN